MVGIVVVVHLVCIMTVKKGEASLPGLGTHFVRERRACRIVYSSRVENNTEFKRV